MGFVKGLQQVGCTRCAACLTPPDAGSSVVHATSARCCCRPGEKHRRPRASADCARVARQVRRAVRRPWRRSADQRTDPHDGVARAADLGQGWLRESRSRCRGTASTVACAPHAPERRSLWSGLGLRGFADHRQTAQRAACRCWRPLHGSGLRHAPFQRQRRQRSGQRCRPIFAIQRQPDGLRRMPKDIAEELAGLGVQRAHVRCWGRGAWMRLYCRARRQTRRIARCGMQRVSACGVAQAHTHIHFCVCRITVAGCRSTGQCRVAPRVRPGGRPGPAGWNGRRWHPSPAAAVAGRVRCWRSSRPPCVAGRQR